MNKWNENKRKARDNQTEAGLRQLLGAPPESFERGVRWGPLIPKERILTVLFSCC